MENTKIPIFQKVLKFLLWGIAIVAAYVGLSWFWHTKVIDRWVKTAADPFANGVALPHDVYEFLNKVFYDFPGLQRELTNPLRYRRDPNGKNYFTTRSTSRDAFSAHFSAMGELSLLQRKDDDANEYFRFTHIPWKSKVECYSASISPDKSKSVQVSVTRLNGEGFFFPGEIEARKTHAVPISEFSMLIEETRTESFWNQMAALEASLDPFENDSIWIYEHSSPSGYQVVEVGVSALGWMMSHQLGIDMEDIDVKTLHAYKQIGLHLMEKFELPEFSETAPE